MIPLRAAHRPSRTLALPVTATILAALFAPASAARADRTPTQFAGLWPLDLKESETLQKKMDEMRRSGGGFRGGGGPRGGMGGGPPMGGMGRGGGGGHRHEGDDSAEAVAPSRNPEMSDFARPPMSLLIEPGDSTLVLSERGRPLQVLVLGDPVTVGAAIQPDAPHVQARWRGARLVAERAGTRGGRVTQQFELDDHGKKLTIRTRVEGRSGRPPFELKRVYNRSDGDADVPPPSPVPPDSGK